MGWQGEFSVGDPEMDKDHQEIFAMVNEFRSHVLVELGDQLTEIDRRFLEAVIEKLVSYSAYHFAQEEDHMRQMGYPGFDAHLALHIEMSTKLKAMRSQLNFGNIELVTEVAEFLGEWWSEHILKADMAYYNYAKANKAN